MPKRSISDDEIALIKGMLARGMKNQEIQFFFNHPDRPVNSGRITGIRNGKYSNAAKIAAAKDDVVDAFIRKAAASAEISSGVATATKDPLSPESLIKFFVEGKAGIWKLKVGESDEHECKAAFGFKYAHKWLRAVAALANNRGGYLLFGVHDKGAKGPSGEDLSHVVCGLNNDEFANADPSEFAARVKSMFDPTPRVQVTTITPGGKTVGVIHVEQHGSRPIVAVKTEGDIREGDIFFRYPGQSSRIKYSEFTSYS